MELIDRTPPDSPLRRVSFGAKLLFVTVTGAALTVWRTPAMLGLTIALTVVLYFVARVPASAWWKTMRTVALFVVMLVLFQWWNGDLELGIRTAVQMLAMVSLAALITATTPFDEVISSVHRWAGPLRRFGADPDAIALTVGMTVRFIPMLSVAAAETSDALRARGVRPWPWRIMFPLVRRSLLLADDVGAALVAREPA